MENTPIVSNSSGVEENNTPQEEKKSFWTRQRIILSVVIVGLLLRLWAAWQLPVDFDEPTYIDAGYKYAQMLQVGDIQGIIDYSENSEHPPLVKLLYGVSFLVLGRGVERNTALFIARCVSAVFGSLAVLVVAVIDPLAGFFVAVQTLIVKYTSQAYLEAVPLFFALLALYLILRSKPGTKKWIILSAVALGITAAGKYSYFPILFPIIYLLIFVRKERIGILLVYFLITGVVFLLFDPYLWHTPIQRFFDSISFHAAYSQGSHVQQVNYPWYQPFLWVARSNGFIWHPDVFFYLGIDGLIFLFALPGFYLDWSRRRWVIIWAVTGMLSLLLWPTKWPQYSLVVLPAFCMAASTSVRLGYQKLKEQELYWEWFQNMFPRPSRRYVVIFLILGGFLFVGALASQVVIEVNKIGWSTITTDTSELPNNSVNEILSLPDGRMLIGTDAGAVFWRGASKDEVVDDWNVIDQANSPLPSQKVLSVASSEDGVYWFGTDQGLARYDGYEWTIYHSTDFGLDNEQVNDIAIDHQGRVWIATLGGVAVLEGDKWQAFTKNNSNLLSEAVFTIAVDQNNGRDDIWFGTLRGISRFNLESQVWQSFTQPDIDLGWGGVSDLMIDSRGVLWASTEGGGINRWDGNGWDSIRVSNSKLPYSTIETVAELEPGEYWIAASIPNSSGGVLAKFDGMNWHTYRQRFSGYSGAETVTMAKDATGRYWFGTRTEGIDIYKPSK